MSVLCSPLEIERLFSLVVFAYLNEMFCRALHVSSDKLVSGKIFKQTTVFQVLSYNFQRSHKKVEIYLGYEITQIMLSSTYFRQEVWNNCNDNFSYDKHQIAIGILFGKQLTSSNMYYNVLFLFIRGKWFTQRAKRLCVAGHLLPY